MIRFSHMINKLESERLTEEIKNLKLETLKDKEYAKELIKILDHEYGLLDMKLGYWKGDLWATGLSKSFDEIRKLTKVSIKRCKLHIAILKREVGWEAHLAMMKDKNDVKELDKLEKRDEYVLKNFIKEANDARRLMIGVNQRVNSIQSRIKPDEFENIKSHCQTFLALMSNIMGLLMKTVDFLRKEHEEIKEIMASF